jgi:hypothetical protein
LLLLLNVPAPLLLLLTLQPSKVESLDKAGIHGIVSPLASRHNSPPSAVWSIRLMRWMRCRRRG